MEIPSNQEDAVRHVREWAAFRVKDLRTSRGITQTELARLMSVHFTRVSDLELNRADYKASSLYRAARAMGVNMEMFFRGCPGWGKLQSQGEEMVIVSAEDAKSRIKDLGFTSKQARDVVTALASR